MNESDRKQIESIERDRRRREEELFLLLLLFVGGWFSSAGATRRNPRNVRSRVVAAIDHGTDPATAIRDTLLGNPAIHLPGLIFPATRMMEEAWVSGYKRAFLTAGLGKLETLPQYDATPFQMQATAIVEDLIQRLGLLVTMAMSETDGMTTPQKMRYVWEQFTRYGFTGGKPQTVNEVSKGSPGFALQGVATDAILSAWGGGFYIGNYSPSVAMKLSGFKLINPLDSRTSDICWDRCDPPLMLPKENAFWKTNVPPLHRFCRTLMFPLYGPQEWSDRLPTVPVQPGFGAAPAMAFGYAF